MQEFHHHRDKGRWDVQEEREPKERSRCYSVEFLVPPCLVKGLKNLSIRLKHGFCMDFESPQQKEQEYSGVA